LREVYETGARFSRA